MLSNLNPQLRSSLPFSLTKLKFNKLYRTIRSSSPSKYYSTFSISPSIIFSGIQPTGAPHLGNYFGAVQRWVRLQNEAPPTTQLLFSIVDLHAITVNQDAMQLRKWKRQTLATLLAAGLDPTRSTVFFQSSVPAHAELMWILSCTASAGFLSRMTQWKSKLALPHQASLLDHNAKAVLKLGLFSYPVLQAADILLYGTTHVPVGQDQVQHIEFARECAINFNALHGAVLSKPEVMLSPAKRVMSLKEPSLKMSKSHDDDRSRILITDTPEDISLKIRLALTDSVSGVSFDELKRPGVSNLLAIAAYMNPQHGSVEDLARSCRDLTMREFKEKVATIVVDGLADIRKNYHSLMEVENSGYFESIALEGAKRAREKANITMGKVRHAVGLESISS